MTVRVRIEPVRKQVFRILADLLIAGGLAGILYGMWALADGAVYQYMQAREFAKQIGASAPAGMPLKITPAGPSRLDSSPLPPPAPRAASRTVVTFSKPDPRILGKLEIPSIGLSVMVRDGVDEATLRKAVGHLPSSAGPGQPGNFVLLGHRDTFFRPLRDIARGDLVQIETRQGRFTYSVQSITARSPDALPIEAGDSQSIATLITCYPFSFTGPAPHRFVVQARLVQPGGKLVPAVH